MAGTRRLEQLAESVEGRLDLPDGDLVVALSGGADSGALAYLCLKIGREVSAVHIDHGLPNSPLMEKAAKAVAAELGLDLKVRRVVVPEGPSPEGQARRARYVEFAQIEDGPILTGHTRDDVVETVVFNLIRGTGPRGLAGIPYFRPANIYRPMLRIARSETREIAALAGLPFVDDPMNDDLTLTRNRVRRTVIPVLEELNPRFSDSIARLARTVAADNELLDGEAARVRLIHEQGRVGVAVGDLVSVPRALADRVLKNLIAHGVGSGEVSAERVEALWEVALGEKGRLELTEGVVARRSGPLLVIDRPADLAPSESTRLTPGLHRVGNLEFDVAAGGSVCTVLPLSRWSAVFPAETALVAMPSGVVIADGEPAWVPGEKRFPVAWYQPGALGYLSVSANEVTGWTSGP